MFMRLKRKFKRLLITIIVLIIVVLSVMLWNKIYNYEKGNKESNTNYNEEPVYKEHDNEFEIAKSNYLERFYERYKAYKKIHPDYSDDKIITYVNIGLDYEYYTNMENTDMSLGKLIICNKYHTLKKDYVPNLVNLGSNYGGGQ